VVDRISKVVKETEAITSFSKHIIIIIISFQVNLKENIISKVMVMVMVLVLVVEDMAISRLTILIQRIQSLKIKPT